MDWVDTNGKVITELPDNCFGFVYKIEYKDGTYYYGKKQVRFKKTLPMLSNGSRRPNSKLITKRIPYTKEELENKPKSFKRKYKLVNFEEVWTISSSWGKYTGSSNDTPPDSEISKKIILYYSSNKRTLTYLETYVLFSTHAVVKKDCHNSNILGKFFDNSLQGLIKS